MQLVRFVMRIYVGHSSFNFPCPLYSQMPHISCILIRHNSLFFPCILYFQVAPSPCVLQYNFINVIVAYLQTNYSYFQLEFESLQSNSQYPFHFPNKVAQLIIYFISTKMVCELFTNSKVFLIHNIYESYKLQIMIVYVFRII